ncbi:MAG: diaminopimelate decarboxylase [Bacteroidales bacterium]|nr:diaminopimelate decarboxylase [Bacteroidales bacterium]
MKPNYERPVIQKLNTGLLNKFGSRTGYNPVKQIDGVAVSDLINQYGSPLFVISEKIIRQTYRRALKSFNMRYPKVQFAWSYKTNYLDAVCNVFHQEGSWAEVVSGFEYQKALRNGVPGNLIIFNGPDKSAEDLKIAVDNGSLIHIDHFDELFTLIETLEGTGNRARVAIRINMDTGIYPQWDRFGFNYESGEAWNAIMKIASQENLILEGLHCHIGTYMLTPGAYAVAAQKLCDLAHVMSNKIGVKVKYLDMGGGFCSTNTLKGSYLLGSDVIPSFDEYAEAIVNTIMNSGFKPEDLPLLILETGRALIDEAGYLLGTVLASKRLADGRRATIVDIGVNILFTSFWYNHRISPAQELTQHAEEMAIYGPLCMNIDCIRETVSLPLLKKGDRIVVHEVGAYNMTQWMQFITLRPNVVMIDTTGKVHLIRRQETVDTIVEQESLPDHLKEFKL